MKLRKIKAIKAIKKAIKKARMEKSNKVILYVNIALAILILLLLLTEHITIYTVYKEEPNETFGAEGECELYSVTLVKFTQELVRTGLDTPETSVNWFTNVYEQTADIPYPLDNTGALLLAAYLDYAAEWKPTEQKQYGAAFGTREGAAIPINESRVVTGNFKVKAWYPYFVSATKNKDVTYVGKLPKHVRFVLKVKGTLTENYIVLPLDTTIKKASQICDDPELRMLGTNRVGIWDVYEQQISNPVTGQPVALACQVIKMGNDFDVYPGQVYYITIPQDAVWHQK